MQLIDIGAFSGGSLLEICELLEKEEIEVQRITLGVADSAAVERISKKIENVQAAYTFKFYEWIELRDLWGIDGRSVGNIGKRRAFMPYWENLTEWATIAPEYEEKVQKLCKDYNLRLIAGFERENLPPEKIGILVKYRRRKP